MTRLQELGFTDFKGGLRIHDERSFQIADNESPQMLNMRADERLGIYTRRGIRRWNDAAVTADPWDPRMGYEHDYSDGTNAVFVTNNNTIHVANNSTTFVDMGMACNAEPHLADFASWGDTTYIATGRKVEDLTPGAASGKYEQDGTDTLLPALGVGTYNDDYTTPTLPGVNGVMPRADFVEAHAGYLFCASVREDEGSGVVDMPNRLRWSHPNSPEDWAKDDYLDIEIGGGRITGLMSFQDHLLIFKTDSMWALFGYNSESWQLIKVSPSIGIPSPTAMARSPLAAFFYSVSGRGDIYTYRGNAEPPARISDNIQDVVENIPSSRFNDVWMGWTDDRLLVSIPFVARWDPTLGGDLTDNSLFSFDPYMGGGSWEMHRPAKGSVGPIIERSDTLAERSLVVLFGADVDACLAQINVVDGAYDLIDDVVTPLPFYTRYATNWKFAGAPELRKHWMRPRFIFRKPRSELNVLIEVYRDYAETEAARSFQVTINSQGQYRWRTLGADAPEGDGFDWGPTASGRGGIWAGEVFGGVIVRGRPFGVARSVQVVFATTPASLGEQWGIDAVILKYINRRFTT